MNIIGDMHFLKSSLEYIGDDRAEEVRPTMLAVWPKQNTILGLEIANWRIYTAINRTIWILLARSMCRDIIGKVFERGILNCFFLQVQVVVRLRFM